MKLLLKIRGAAPEAPPLVQRSITEPLISIGSDGAASLFLSGAGVAPEQAVIVNENGEMLLINRAEGTVLNDQVLSLGAHRPLAHGDRLFIGNYLIIFVSEEAETPAETREGLRRANPTNPLPGMEQMQDAQQQQAPPPPVAPSNGREQSARNFAAILDSLRTEEDSFYLLIEGGQHNGRRVVLESMEMPLGWDETGQFVSFDAATVVALRALLRKDWSGVMLHAQGMGMVAVNAEPVESTRRLRNGDRVMIMPTAVTAAQSQCFLVFHEPASLLVLDSLLPQRLPPVLPEHYGEPVDRPETQALQPTASARRRIGFFSTERRFFGYFTLFETSLMMAGTLLAALIIFLILEYA